MNTHPAKKRLLIIQAAGLGWDFLRARFGEHAGGWRFRPAETVFPAVTCTVQASFRTGLPPERHGMPANGFFDRALRRVFFWEQSAALVSGPRLWDAFRARGGSVGLLFWQQSLGENADVLLSPAPVHRHHGGMIPACYSRPEGCYDTLRASVGAPFALRHYWGPMASVRSSRWIGAAVRALLGLPLAPACCLVYLPLLDYELQRRGPDHPRARQGLDQLLRVCGELRAVADRHGYEVLLFGDYAIRPCPGGPVAIQQALHEAGWFASRAVGRRLYPDLFASRAVAVTDHEIAHVYVRDRGDIDRVRSVLSGVEGIAEIHAPPGGRAARQGDLLAVAAEGRWFSYRWWSRPREAPDYAGHVDIHNKPGFDPCELFHGWPPGRIASDDHRVRGTHGRSGPGREIAWAATHPDLQGSSLMELSRCSGAWLDAYGEA